MAGLRQRRNRVRRSLAHAGEASRPHISVGPVAPVWPHERGQDRRLCFDVGGPFEWSLAALVQEGRARCIRFECRGDVTPENLHRFQLGRFLEEAALMASRPEDEIPRKTKGWSSQDEARSARAAVAERHHKHQKSRQRLPDDFLAEVADVYRQHVSAGKPSKAVAEHFKYSQPSARRVVREARLRGLLGPARPGRGGEDPHS